MDDFENKLTELHDRVLSKALTEDEQNSYTESLFESIKHINEYGEEFWYARELQRALEYTEWRNFSRVIDRAVTACENSGNDVFHHFVEVNKTIDMPKSATKEITDYALSRYACYLIVQNGDSRKKVIALGQTYFAVKTRQQELIDNFNELNEDQKRLAIRREMAEHNKIRVIITNKQKAVKIPTGIRMLVRRCCNAVLRLEKFEGSAEISVTFTDNEGIKALNKQYRDKDIETDVLSFPMGENGVYDTNPETGAQILGDVVISMEKARDQAELFGHSLQREVGYLTAHSVLHLLGYDHMEKLERVRMREKEELVMEQLGLPASSSYIVDDDMA